MKNFGKQDKTWNTAIWKLHMQFPWNFSISTCIRYIHWFALKGKGVKKLCTPETKKVKYCLLFDFYEVLFAEHLHQMLICISQGTHGWIFLFVTLKIVF